MRTKFFFNELVIRYLCAWFSGRRWSRGCPFRVGKILKVSHQKVLQVFASFCASFCLFNSERRLFRKEISRNRTNFAIRKFHKLQWKQQLSEAYSREPDLQRWWDHHNILCPAFLHMWKRECCLRDCHLGNSVPTRIAVVHNPRDWTPLWEVSVKSAFSLLFNTVQGNFKFNYVFKGSFKAFDTLKK